MDQIPAEDRTLLAPDTPPPAPLKRRSRVWVPLLALLLIAAVAAWLLRERLFGPAEAPPPTTVSAQAADYAEQKLARLQSGDTVRLSEVELASLLQFRLRQRLPDLVQNPTVGLSGDTMVARARIAVNELPQTRELDQIRVFLPDTAEVRVAGFIRPVRSGLVALEVQQATVGGIPVPRRLYPRLLQRLGRYQEPGIPPAALPIRLGQGVGSVYLENGQMILVPANPR